MGTGRRRVNAELQWCFPSATPAVYPHIKAWPPCNWTPLPCQRPLMSEKEPSERPKGGCRALVPQLKTRQFFSGVRWAECKSHSGRADPGCSAKPRPVCKRLSMRGSVLFTLPLLWESTVTEAAQRNGLFGLMVPEGSW